MSLFSGVAAFLREAPIELYRFELGGETYRYAATSGEPTSIRETSTRPSICCAEGSIFPTISPRTF